MGTIKGHLENGITLINHERKDAQSVYMQFAFNVGSRDEDDTNRGVAHFLEHMMFKGTKTKTAEEIADILSSYAIKRNAYTGFYKTSYIADCMAEDKEIALKTMADMLTNPSFLSKNITKEKKVICDERLRSVQNEDRTNLYNFFKLFFLEKYFEKRVLGSTNDIKKMSKKILLDFYNRFYCAENLTIVIVGKMSYDESFSLITEHFKGINSGEKNTPLEPTYKGGAYEGKVKKDSNKINIGFYSKGANPYATAILANILGGDMSSRLFKSIRGEKGLVYGINSSLSSNCSMFNISTSSKEQFVKEVVIDICNHLLVLQNNLVSNEEIQKSKRILIANTLRATEANSSYAQELLEHSLEKDELWQPVKEINTIQKVSKEDVLKAAQAIFSSKPTYYISGKVDDSFSYAELCRALKP